MAEEPAETTGGATAAPAAETPPAGRAGGTRHWWLVAPAFVLGVFAGAVAVGLLHEDPPPIPVAVPDETADEPRSDANGSATPGATAEIAVNEACLRVVDATEDLVAVIDQLGDSAADFDIAGLNDAIRQLQPLEGELRDDLAGCEADTLLPEDLTPMEEEAEEPGAEEPSDSPATTVPTTAPPD